MTQSNKRDTQPSVQDVALIVGAAPASAQVAPGCSRKTACGSASQPDPDKPVLQEKTHGVRRYACEASEPAAVELLFQNVVRDLGAPTLVVHNIDGRVPDFWQGDYRSRPKHGARHTSELSVQRVFGRSAGRSTDARKHTGRQRHERNDHLHERKRSPQRLPVERCLCNGMSCQIRTRTEHGRELMPEGIHIACVPIDAAIGWTQEDGTRAHRLAERLSTTTWPTRTASRKPICSCIASIGRLGRSKSCTTVGREMVTGARAGPLPRRCVTVEPLPVRQNGSFARSEGEADVDNRNPHREFGLVSPEVAGRVSGVEFLQRLLDATYPAPPFSEVAEVWPISVEVGRVAFEASPSARSTIPWGWSMAAGSRFSSTPPWVVRCIRPSSRAGLHDGRNEDDLRQAGPREHGQAALWGAAACRQSDRQLRRQDLRWRGSPHRARLRDLSDLHHQIRQRRRCSSHASGPFPTTRRA